MFAGWIGEVAACKYAAAVRTDGDLTYVVLRAQRERSEGRPLVDHRCVRAVGECQNAPVFTRADFIIADAVLRTNSFRGTEMIVLRWASLMPNGPAEDAIGVTTYECTRGIKSHPIIDRQICGKQPSAGMPKARFL